MFFDQFDVQNLQGESCPGMADCRETPGKPLNKYGVASGQRVETICGGCVLKRSKPESVPEHLQRHVAAGFELAEVREIGGRFAYPDGLTAAEWTALAAHNRGKNKAEVERRKRDEKKKPKN